MSNEEMQEKARLFDLVMDCLPDDAWPDTHHGDYNTWKIEIPTTVGGKTFARQYLADWVEAYKRSQAAETAVRKEKR